MNPFLKVLLATTCFTIMGHVALNANTLYMRHSRLQAFYTARDDLSVKFRACNAARSLLNYYPLRGSRQGPGMMSWNDARDYVRFHCNPEQLGAPNSAQLAAAIAPFPSFPSFAAYRTPNR